MSVLTHTIKELQFLPVDLSRVEHVVELEDLLTTEGRVVRVPALGLEFSAGPGEDRMAPLFEACNGAQRHVERLSGKRYPNAILVNGFWELTGQQRITVSRILSSQSLPNQVSRSRALELRLNPIWSQSPLNQVGGSLGRRWS